MKSCHFYSVKNDDEFCPIDIDFKILMIIFKKEKNYNSYIFSIVTFINMIYIYTFNMYKNSD